MYSLEFEPAKVRFERKESAPEEGRRPEHYRPIKSFGIHHRARQRMVQLVLKSIYENVRHPSAYGMNGRGRDQAVQAIMGLVHSPEIEFVGEVDITNFYPSIGEEDNGRFASENLLFREFPFLPRAVIQSTVLSAWILVSLPSSPGLEALSHEFNTRTGIPQGSALSPFIAHLVMIDLMAEAERLTGHACCMVGYVDNIQLAARNRDDIHMQKNTLSVCASNNRFGSFRLRLSETIRHKTKEFGMLGYRLRFSEEGSERKIHVSIASRGQRKLNRRLCDQLDRFRPDAPLSNDYRNRTVEDIAARVDKWASGYALVNNAHQTGLSIFDKVLGERFRKRRMLEQRVIAHVAERKI